MDNIRNTLLQAYAAGHHSPLDMKESIVQSLLKNTQMILRLPCDGSPIVEKILDKVPGIIRDLSQRTELYWFGKEVGCAMHAQTKRVNFGNCHGCHVTEDNKLEFYFNELRFNIHNHELHKTITYLRTRGFLKVSRVKLTHWCGIEIMLSTFTPEEFHACLSTNHHPMFMCDFSNPKKPSLYSNCWNEIAKGDVYFNKNSLIKCRKMCRKTMLPIASHIGTREYQTYAGKLIPVPKV